MVPRREALLGNTFETRKISSRRPAIASAITSLGIAIHFGGIDMGHAEIDAAAQGCDRAVAIAAVDIPGALPDHGHLRTAAAELPRPHFNSPISATRTVPVTDSVT